MSDFRTSLRVYFVYLGISKLVYIPISTHPVSLLSRKLPCRLNRNHIFRKPPHHSWTFYSQHPPPKKKQYTPQGPLVTRPQRWGDQRAWWGSSNQRRKAEAWDGSSLGSWVLSSKSTFWADRWEISIAVFFASKNYAFFAFFFFTFLDSKKIVQKFVNVFGVDVFVVYVHTKQSGWFSWYRIIRFIWINLPELVDGCFAKDLFF